MIIGTCLRPSKIEFVHLFDWAFVYYIGTTFTGILYWLEKRKQRNQRDQYIQLLYKAEKTEKKLLKVPTMIWV
jgi:hypothetical protein